MSKDLIEWNLSAILHIIRNPYGFTEDQQRDARLAAADRIEQLEAELKDTIRSRDWYKGRVDLLQANQSRMRDPERTIVCDILANGFLLEPSGGRYALKAQSEPVACESCSGDRRVYVGERFIACPSCTTPQPSAAGWLRAVDEAMVCSHLGVVNASDDYATAKKKLNVLICWSVQIDRDLGQGAEDAKDAAIVAMVDAAMVEMKNISPPLRRSECQRLILAAIAARG
jgi:hypothetical protein